MAPADGHGPQSTGFGRDFGPDLSETGAHNAVGAANDTSMWKCRLPSGTAQERRSGRDVERYAAWATAATALHGNFRVSMPAGSERRPRRYWWPHAPGSPVIELRSQSPARIGGGPLSVV